MARVSMLLRCMAAVALLSGAPRAFAKGAVPDPEVKGVRQIVLDEKTVGKAIAIRTARNLLTTVELPEDMLGAPTCGDCTDGKNPESDALFRVEPVAQGRYLAITPNAEAPARAKRTTPVEYSIRCRRAAIPPFIPRGSDNPLSMPEQWRRSVWLRQTGHDRRGSSRKDVAGLRDRFSVQFRSKRIFLY